MSLLYQRLPAAQRSFRFRHLRGFLGNWPHHNIICRRNDRHRAGTTNTGNRSDVAGTSRRSDDRRFRDYEFSLSVRSF